jgi:hypothetical protein
VTVIRESRAVQMARNITDAQAAAPAREPAPERAVGQRAK